MSGLGSNNGWLEAAIAWEVCASLHRQYCKGKDDLFTTRQSDFVKHAENARRLASRGQTPAGAAQAVQQDAERLDYLQECGTTVEVLPGRPGWTFRIGGLHGTVNRSVRAAIDAARAAQKGTND